MVARRRFLLTFVAKIGLLLVLLSVSSSSSPADSSPIPLTLDKASAHDLQITDVGNGEYEIKTTGNDPYVFLRTDGRSIDPHAQPILAFECFSTTDVGRVLLFVGSHLEERFTVTYPDLPRSEGWAATAIDIGGTMQPPAQPINQLRITFGDRAGITARVRNFQMRAFTPAEARLAAVRDRRIAVEAARAVRLDAYLAQNYPSAIDSVECDGTEILVHGHIAGFPNAMLAEIPMWEDVTQLKHPYLQSISLGLDHRFSALQSLETGDHHDPLLSAWAVVTKNKDGSFQLLSAAHYIDSQKPRADLSPAAPASRKGLGGCPVDHPDMAELGISTITFNIVLNQVFSGDSRTGIKCTYAGKTWYVNPAVLDQMDHDLQTAYKHGWMVSAIVLIRPPGNPPDLWTRDAACPDSDPPGVFVLPNFTSRDGVEAYAAAMNFLAERYSRPDGKYGRIHHWIMHNEINGGFYWSNAGTIKMQTYLDIYQKSMRVAYLMARQYDANAQPFISLDHFWTGAPDARSYRGRDLLDRLVAVSRKEGDFQWGIAYHPYAEDLRNPRTWEDAHATFDYNTFVITFKNLEVINAYAERPDVAYRGTTPRLIELTEQGLNSPDYGPKSQTDQAAGMAYAWEKMRPLKNICAFDYHNWRDDRDEGGLMIGLRKYPDDKADPGGTKLIWDLYRSMDTADWNKTSAPYLQVVGVHDWSDIHYTGEIHQ